MQSAEARTLSLAQQPLGLWRRRAVMQKISSIDRARSYNGVAKPNGLFDFQHAAAEWLIDRWKKRNDCGFSVLGLDVGCGKTRTAGAFLASPDGPGSHLHNILYITQGGLVRQTYQELHRAFGDTLPVAKAETSREFNRHWITEGARNSSMVVVVNAALSRTWLPELHCAGYVIVDEAHRYSGDFFAAIGRRIKASDVLLMSATPCASGPLARLVACASAPQLFVFRKGAVLSRQLNMSTVELVGCPHPSDSKDFQELLIHDALARGQVRTALIAAISQCANDCEEVFFAPYVDLLRQSIERESIAASAEIFRRLCHSRVCTEAFLQHSLSQRDRDAVREFFARHNNRRREPRANARAVCACCGLQEEEIVQLHLMQHRIGRNARLPLPWEWGFTGKPFVRAVLRLQSSSEVTSYQQMVTSASPPQNAESSLKCIFLNADLCASQRALRVQRFTRASEDPFALHVLRRSGFGSPGSAGAMVSAIGDGLLVREILDLIADRALLVCDPRCGDVGLNLQCVTHVLSPQVPWSAHEAHQLAGRASRIAKLQNSRRAVQIVSLIRSGTFDALLLRHTKYQLSIASTGSDF